VRMRSTRTSGLHLQILKHRSVAVMQSIGGWNYLCHFQIIVCCIDK
jgi:hypothetical protein